LEIMAQHYDAQSGYLFGLQADGLQFISGKNTNRVPEQLLKLVKAYLEAELEDSSEATVTMADENAADGKSTAFTLDEGITFEAVLVQGIKQDRSIVVGVAALIPANGHLRTANPKVVYAISDALLDKGDVISRYAAQ
jgi:hypothetical protein